MLPVASVVIAAVAAWLASGVEPGQIGRYLGYELVFVIGPGWLLFRAICPGTRSPLTQIAIGWPLGLVAEIALFSLTAALDARDLFYASPVLVGAPAALVWWRRSRASRPRARDEREAPGFSAAQRWTIAAVCVTVFAYFGFTLFARSPIPGSVPEVLYVEDLLFHIAIVAEAQQHWPLQSPGVSGGTLHYHYFAHLHMAAIAQVTGIDTSIVVLRLYLVPLAALLLLQVALLGRSVSGLAWAGPVAAALVALVGEVDLVTPQLAPFLGITPILLWSSPSYLLGLVIFVPLIAVLAGLLEPAVRARLGAALGRREAWVLVLVLALGASGAKVVVLPLVGAGLFACLALVWLRARRLEPTALSGLALCIVLFAATVAVLYGTEGGGLRLGVGGNYELMPALFTVRDQIPDSLVAEVAFWGIGSVLGTVLLLAAPLLGLVWYFRRGGQLGSVEAFLLGTTVAGGLVFVFFVHDVGASFYFVSYGVIAATPLAAAGLCRVTGPWIAGREGPRGPGLLVGAAWLLALCAVAYVSWQLALEDHTVWAYALAYGALAAGLALLAAWWLRAPTAKRPARLAIAVLIVIGTAGLDLFIDTVPETQRRLSSGSSLYDDLSYGTKRDAYEAAVWARDHLDDDAVLAVSNQRSERSRVRAALAIDWPAFAERRTFYEGWVYAIGPSKVDRGEVLLGKAQPNPVRRRLEGDLFYRAEPAALRTMMEDYGVTHLVVDRRDGRVNRRTYDFGRVIYSNGTIDILELEPLSPTRP